MVEARDDPRPALAGEPAVDNGGDTGESVTAGGIPLPALSVGNRGAAGAGFGGAGRASRDDAWVAPILKQLRRKLEAEREYPRIARRLGLEGTVTLQAQVETDGSVGGWDIAARSAHPVLDEAALDAARRIALLRTDAPIPRRIVIVVPLRFVLQRASADGS